MNHSKSKKNLNPTLYPLYYKIFQKKMETQCCELHLGVFSWRRKEWSARVLHHTPSPSLILHSLSLSHTPHYHWERNLEKGNNVGGREKDFSLSSPSQAPLIAPISNGGLGFHGEDGGSSILTPPPPSRLGLP